jgi:NADH-quinone oxidoreductase subunit C
VDYYDYFELVYQLTSLENNHSLVVKTRCYGRENLTVPSVVSLWRGADYQEREIFDLIGISFEGHPNMKRIVLWEGFVGHPLRKDFVQT